MALNLTILGCGYVGTALAKSALNKGWNVSALTRNTQKGEELDSIGVQQVIISDLSSTEWHSHLNPNQDFVVNCVGASSPSPEGYVSSYIDGQSSALQWLETGEVGTYLFTSSCSVYPQTGRKLVDETASCAGVSEKGGLLLAAEKLSFPAPNCIKRSFVLRLAGIYGPGRHLLVNKVKEGVVVDGNESRILNLIHLDDVVSAIESCLNASPQNLGRIYNLSDGQAATRGQIVEWICEKLQISSPGFSENDTEDTPNRKISNQRIVEELNWVPRIPSFMQGYESFL